LGHAVNKLVGVDGDCCFLCLNTIDLVTQTERFPGEASSCLKDKYKTFKVYSFGIINLGLFFTSTINSVPKYFLSVK
jgi:hypothetical protein